MSASVERQIEVEFETRLERPCLFVPSGRLAVYLAVRASLSVGDPLLMTPVTDDVIFFTVLAAGARPVMAPISDADGNIVPDAVPDDQWAGLKGVMATNLYGLPDRVLELSRRCAALGIPFIEDAAHAIETTVDTRPIGTFGDLAAFSLSKHVGAGIGGVLAFSDESQRRDFSRLRDDAIVQGATATVHRLRRAAVEFAEETVVRLGLVWPVRRLRRMLGTEERTGYRMPLRPDELRRAVVRAPDLSRFHGWMRVDRPDYLVPPSTRALTRALHRVRRLDADRDRRIANVARLRALPQVAEGAAVGDPQPLFRVPLLTDDRDRVREALARHVHGIGYIYDPPLDDYAGVEFTVASPAPDAARAWARRVLPVDPLEADAILRALG